MTQKEQLAAMGVQLTAMEKQLTELHHTIIGNGKPGLKIEVDRLNQRQRLRDWVMTIVLAPLVLTVIGFLLTLVF